MLCQSLLPVISRDSSCFEQICLILRRFVFFSDWDGTNFYEQQRATKVAEDLGYIGFAADIYGPDFHTVDGDQRSALAGQYLGNTTLFTGRIQAAIDHVKTMPEVDSENVAIVGYCFGGTGVLMYALMGMSDVKGELLD